MANDEKDVKCPTSKNAPVPVPPPPSRRWRWKLLAAAVFLSVVAYQLPTQSGRDPSATYALCSQDGNNIYTVDEANTSVECIVVQGSRIVDSGDLGALSVLPICDTYTYITLQIRFKKERNLLLACLQSPSDMPQRALSLSQE
jgi:hypothetical protein